MNVEEFRDFCLSFPNTREGMPFQGFFKNAQSILVFYVGEKMFCLFDLNKFDRCTVKCDSILIDELREHAGIDKPFNLSPKHWISVDLTGVVSTELVKDLVSKSYQLVLGTLIFAISTNNNSCVNHHIQTRNVDKAYYQCRSFFLFQA